MPPKCESRVSAPGHCRHQPVRYLVQIGQIDLLPLLFKKIMLPSIVAEELRHPSAPAAVQAWMKQTGRLGGSVTGAGS